MFRNENFTSKFSVRFLADARTTNAGFARESIDHHACLRLCGFYSCVRPLQNESTPNLELPMPMESLTPHGHAAANAFFIFVLARFVCVVILPLSTRDRILVRVYVSEIIF